MTSVQAPTKQSQDRHVATMISNYLKTMEGEIQASAKPPKPPKIPKQEVHSCTAERQAVASISYILPHEGALAGRILQHSVRQMEKLFRDKGPLIFKVGFTHDPVWRWSNTLYGYLHDPDGWTDMLILFISHEPYGPGMLEASLIDKFGGNLFAVVCLSI